jgi:hypothetical protein
MAAMTETYVITARRWAGDPRDLIHVGAAFCGVEIKHYGAQRGFITTRVFLSVSGERPALRLFDGWLGAQLS